MAWADEACYKVEGMTCAACAVTAKVAINKLFGIQDVKISVGEKDARVKFDPAKTTKDAIKESIDGVGYKATDKECKQTKG